MIDILKILKRTLADTANDSTLAVPLEPTGSELMSGKTKVDLMTRPKRARKQKVKSKDATEDVRAESEPGNAED